GTAWLNPQWELPSGWQWPSQWQLPASATQMLARLGWPWGSQGQGASAGDAPAVVLNGPSVQTQFSACPQFFPAQRPPVVPAAQGLRELCFSGFAILHSGQTKTPVFVAQRLNRGLLRSEERRVGARW